MSWIGILETMDPGLMFWTQKHCTGPALTMKTHKKVHTKILSISDSLNPNIFYKSNQIKSKHFMSKTC